MKITLDISIYPSTARRGQHAVAISANGGGEALVLGYVENPEEAKEALKKIFKSDDGWFHDSTVDYHSLKVVTPSPRSI